MSWVAYWTEQAAIHRSRHDTERLLHVERLRALAVRLERADA